MSWKVEDLKGMGKEIARATDLPDEFTGTVESTDIREDRTGRRCLYVNVRLEDGRATVIKYTPMHIPTLAERLLNLGIESSKDFVGKTFLWRKQHFRIGYDRPMPWKVVSE
jgi:hypothetical protein